MIFFRSVLLLISMVNGADIIRTTSKNALYLKALYSTISREKRDNILGNGQWRRMKRKKRARVCGYCGIPKVNFVEFEYTLTNNVSFSSLWELLAITQFELLLNWRISFHCYHKIYETQMKWNLICLACSRILMGLNPVILNLWN